MGPGINPKMMEIRNTFGADRIREMEDKYLP